MADNNQIDEKKLKFDNLFSVPIIQYQSENTDEMNKELREIILKKEKEIPTTNKSNQGGWQSEGDFFRWGGNSIENVYNLFLNLIEASTKKLDFLQTIPMDFHIYGWANVNRKGHSNIAHIHPMSTWSGTYYVDAGDNLDDNEKALYNYTKAIEVDPENSFNYEKRGDFYRDYLGDNEKALTDYNKGIEVDPEDASLYYEIGFIYASAGVYDLALQNLLKVVELEPNYENANNLIGYTYHYSLNQYEKAIEYYTKEV